MIQGLYSFDEVVKMIEKGDSLLLAADSPLLSALPKGNWIGGACSRFIENGTTLISDRNKIFVHNMTGIASNVKLKVYDSSSIRTIFKDAFNNGFSVLILPNFSEVYFEYALKCTDYPNFGTVPICGWLAVASIFSEYEKDDKSLVFSGETGKSYTDAGVVMHVELPDDKYAEIQAFSPYVQDDGDTIVFEENSQNVENVLINGKRQNFRQYLIDNNIDRTPEARNLLAGDYSSSIIMNVGIYEDNESNQGKYVTMGAPVYKGVPYRLAKVSTESLYNSLKDKSEGEIVFSLSCVSNYLRPEVFPKYLSQTNGPFAYGEIAYVLLNHATVYVTVGTI